MNISDPKVRDQINSMAKQIADLTLLDNDEALRKEYLNCLFHTLIKEPRDRFKPAFTRPKKSGGVRVIRPVPKGGKFRFVHERLAEWLFSIPGAMGEDYCHVFRYGINGAIKTHKNLLFAAVYDLKNAHDQVKEKDIVHWLLYYHPVQNKSLQGRRVIKQIADLMCYEGRTWQGLVPTSPAYNMVFRPADKVIQMYCKRYGYLYTRYVDNICISSTEPMNFPELDDFISRTVKSFGFPLNHSKTEHYSNQPAHYQGAYIYDGYSVPDLESQELALSRLRFYSKHKSPHEWRDNATGYWTATNSKCMGRVPKRLWLPFRDYYRLIGRQPPSFRDAEFVERDITLLWRPPV